MVYTATRRSFNPVLTSIHIRNLALIDDLEISLGEGLTVLTGETGAGKSIIVGALNLVLGDRAQSDVVRQQSDEAEVEALFHLAQPCATQNLLAEMGLDNEDGMLVVRRVISRKGKNRVYINGRLATLADLKSIVAPLVDISSQHAHTSLLKVAGHRELVDGFGDVEIPLSRYQEVFAAWETAQCTYRDLQAADQSRSEREDLIRFQLSEIESADPKAGEDDKLATECDVLRHAVELREAAAITEQELYAKGGAASETLALVERALRTAASKDPSLLALADRVDAARIEIEDVAMEARIYRARVDVDPAQLERAEERLATLRRLVRKHGPTLSDVIERWQSMRTELSQFASFDEYLAKLQKQVTECRRELDGAAAVLTIARRRAAQKAADEVVMELAELGMDGACFEVAVEPTAQPTANGADNVEFLLSPNVGESPAPLAKIASGGELSRVMLALKHVMAAADTVDLYVFDEVDTGVGGSIAERIGAKLHHTATHRQVLCITHLPQVACHADHHIRVHKQVSDGRTITVVSHLKGEQRLEEIARLLAGAEVTAHARAHAAALIEAAHR